VGAEKAGSPLVAILGASKPTIWDFSHMPKGRLRAVVLVGTSGQAAAYLSQSTALRTITPKMSDVACDAPGPSLIGGFGSDAFLSSLTNDLFGRRSRVLGDLDPVAINLDGGRPPPPLFGDIPNSAFRPNSTLVRDDLPPSTAGLIRLLQTGAIRNASESDTAAWLAVRERAGLPKVGIGAKYVITRKIEIPRGLFGGNSRKFIVSKNIPLPTKIRSHNCYYTMTDGRSTC